MLTPTSKLLTPTTCRTSNNFSWTNSSGGKCQRRITSFSAMWMNGYSQPMEVPFTNSTGAKYWTGCLNTLPALKKLYIFLSKDKRAGAQRTWMTYTRHKLMGFQPNKTNSKQISLHHCSFLFSVYQHPRLNWVPHRVSTQKESQSPAKTSKPFTRICNILLKKSNSIFSALLLSNPW